MKFSALFCLFSALTTTLLAAPPQYSPRKDIATGLPHLTGIAVADFNGDGIADIALTDNSDKHVVVYLGGKANTFSAPISTLVQTSAVNTTGLFNLVAGDFNEDGKQDLIVGPNSSEPLIYLSGNGDGTFTQQGTIPVSLSFFTNARVVDLNHDSHLDLVVQANPGFRIFLGDGRGNFQPPPGGSGSAPPTAAYDIAAADFNGDNTIDLLTSYPSTNSVFSGIALNLGNGDGSVRSYTIAADSNSSNELSAPWYLAAADFNGDGKQDVLIGEADADILFYGNGDGTFNLNNPDSPATLPPINPYNLAVPLVAAADMDGDGKVDAIIADDSSQTVDVDINNGSGNFMGVPGHFNVPDVTLAIDKGTSHLVVADLNGDGLPDIVVTNPTTQNVSVFFSIRPKTTPALTLTSSASAPFVNSSISFTAKVTGSTPFTPTGTVTLLDGATSVGQQSLDSTGQAVLSLSNLTAGQHSVTASYSGDTNFNPATSSVLTQSVTDFQISLPTSSQTVTAGGAATYSLTATPAGGFTGSITLTCAQLPSLTTCDPLTIPVTGQPATATLTVHTTAPVRSQYRPSIRAGSVGLLSIALTALLPFRRRRRFQIIAAVVAVLVTGFAVGCSGGSSNSSQPPVTVTPGTPQGTTPFTITSSITQGGQTLTHTTTATLVVQ